MDKAKRLKMSIPDESNSIRALLQNLIDMKDDHDVTLISGKDKKRISAHRAILKASSKYFKALLGPNFSEGNKQEIPLEFIDGATLKTIVNFIYTGRIEIDETNVGDIIGAASQMELVRLEEKCAKFWTAILAIDNCVEIFLNADRYHLTNLRSKALKLICDRFEEVPIDESQQFDVKNLQEVLKLNQITAPETVIFDRLVQWINHTKIKAKIAPEMLKLIRLDHISSAFLIETVEAVYDRYGCGKMVVNEYHKRLLHPHAICSHRYAPKEIHCISLNSSENGLNIQKYNSAENSWSEFKAISLSAAKRNFGSIVFNGRLFVLGGRSSVGNISNQSIYLNCVESYSLDDSTKIILPNMVNWRSDFTPIAVGKYIYAFGGFRASILDACERYDTVARGWQPRQKIPNAIYHYAIEELNGQIYIFGGYNSAGQASQDLYCYYPDTNSWTEKSRIAYATISCPSLAKTEQFLYAMQPDGTVHQYEPARDIWTKIGSFGNRITVSRTLNSCNQIYAVCSDGKLGNLKLECEGCAFIPLAAAPTVPSSSTSVYLFLN